MLRSIKIEGDVLDWKSPVEITFGDKPVILTGRNGAGKSLIGKLIETSISCLKNEKGAYDRRRDLCRKHGVHKITMTLERPFYNQWDGMLVTNLPILIDHQERHEYMERFGNLNEVFGVEINIDHHMAFIYDSARKAEPEFYHYLVLKGYCEAKDGTIDLSGRIDLEPTWRGPGDWRFLVHDAVVHLDRFLKERGLRVIPLDDEIRLLTTDEMEGLPIDEYGVAQQAIYQTPSQMRLLIKLFMKQFQNSEEWAASKYWELSHSPPKLSSSAVSSSYVFIDEEGDYPNYFSPLKLKFIGVKREYNRSIARITDPRSQDELAELFGEFSDVIQTPYNWDTDIKSAMEVGFSFNRRGFAALRSKVPEKSINDIWDRIFPNDDDADNEYEVKFGSIIDGIQAILSQWSRLGGEKDKAELIILLRHFWWKRLLEDAPEQKIAHFEFGFDPDMVEGDLPSGYENLLRLLREAMFAEEGTILFIDEPEISLHIDWQSKIVDTLWKLGMHNSLILTTHSPEIVMSNLDKVITLPPVEV